MKWIRWVFLKIQSRHDFVHRWTDGQMHKVIPVYPLSTSLKGGIMMIYFDIINGAIKLLKLTQFSTALLVILAGLKLSQNIFLSCRCDTINGTNKAIKKSIFQMGWEILMSVKPRLYFTLSKCFFFINFNSITKQDHVTKLETCLETGMLKQCWLNSQIIIRGFWDPTTF